MSAKEIYADGALDERRSSRRFVIILTASILLLFALTVGALYAIFNGKLKRGAPAQSAAPSRTSVRPQSGTAARVPTRRRTWIPAPVGAGNKE